MFNLSEPLLGTEDRQKLHKITKNLEILEPTTDDTRYCQKYFTYLACYSYRNECFSKKEEKKVIKRGTELTPW